MIRPVLLEPPYRGVYRVRNKVLNVPVKSLKDFTRKTEKVFVPLQEVTPENLEGDFDRVHFISQAARFDYEFEGVQKVDDGYMILLGDLKLKT